MGWMRRPLIGKAMTARAGLLSIGEWDWDSMCLAVTDRELGRAGTAVP